MSEEIKFEPVFGPQDLFDGADPDIFLVETNGVYKTFHKETTGKVSIWTGNGCDLAMRRIIRTPTWTVADQKAGKLPTAGMIGSLNNGRQIEYLGKSVGGTLHHVRFMDDGECIRISLFDFLPIESPEEKAARLREEWCDFALKIINHKFIDSRGPLAIYDALLSGDLPVPVKE